MPTPAPNPTDPRPDQAPNPDSQATAGQIPSSTQENMGDGSGIRGDYGDSEQTNGLEGGPDQPQTDTELTGS